MNTFPEKFFRNKASSLNRRARRMGAEGRVTAKQLFRLVSNKCKWTCQYCGKRPLTIGPPQGPTSPDALTIDHKKPLNEGGSGSVNNLTVACYECNNGKDRQKPKNKESDSHHLLPRFRK